MIKKARVVVDRLAHAQFARGLSASARADIDQARVVLMAACDRAERAAQALRVDGDMPRRILAEDARRSYLLPLDARCQHEARLEKLEASLEMAMSHLETRVSEAEALL